MEHVVKNITTNVYEAPTLQQALVPTYVKLLKLLALALIAFLGGVVAGGMNEIKNARQILAAHGIATRDYPFAMVPDYGHREPIDLPIDLRPGPGEAPILLRPGPGEIPIELKPAGEPKVADPKPDTVRDPRMPQPPSNVMPQPRSE